MCGFADGGLRDRPVRADIPGEGDGHHQRADAVARSSLPGDLAAYQEGQSRHQIRHRPVNGHSACRRATSAPSPTAIPSGNRARRAGRGRVVVTGAASLGRLPWVHLGHHRQVRVRRLRYAEDQRAVLHPPGEPDHVTGVVGREGRGLIDQAIASDLERPAEQRPPDWGMGGLGGHRCSPTQTSS